ncbi:tripartite tricarboxylate transporter TctB family protein [Roseovarius sp. A-2]|uniref:tripartite tricarboxylate transporter TctB family protein n=1 Tax=Roseovarius sp. A-2 TaxID=1570360 RepID=UPI0009B521D3|nr:tripartite tricarboxylate transporter TctB family protein [Roseovarius sp. A-2]GAW34782.1 tripartite tricarboxylate transporter TctB family protein [Roseovarius sp. A-2]
MRVTDLTLGILTLLGGITIFLSAMNFQAIPGQAYGAGTMPRAVAAVTVLVGLFIIVQAILSEDRNLGFRLADWTRSGAALARAACVLALILGYILVSPILGFVSTAFVLMLAAMLTLGTRLPVAVIVSALATVTIQQSFGKLLLVPLPRSAFFSFLW